MSDLESLRPICAYILRYTPTDTDESFDQQQMRLWRRWQSATLLDYAEARERVEEESQCQDLLTIAEDEISDLEDQLREQQDNNIDFTAQIKLLTQQLTDLRRWVNEVADTLEAMPGIHEWSHVNGIAGQLRIYAAP